MNLSFKNFKFFEVAVIAVLAAALALVITSNLRDSQAKDRDAIRISDIGQIRLALGEFFDEKGTYPVCLYKKEGCTSLEGSEHMSMVPHDPSTNLPYAYASIGTGTDCRTFHLGTSLERTGSQALLTGADAPPEPDTALCAGSEHDFSGLSYAPGGEPCNADAGIAQPTEDHENGETCFDLKPRRR
ncbi:hypothetical protein H7X87_01665 [Acetobacteraceae bacterium]|nr:hypothetical protein [Candidatus Parcubacteria bacterium]